MYSIDLIQDILVSIVSVSFYLNTEWMYFSPPPVHFFNDTSEVLVIWLQLFVLLLLQCKMWVHFTWYQPYFKVLVDMEAADTSQWYFKQKNIYIYKYTATILQQSTHRCVRAKILRSQFFVIALNYVLYIKGTGGIVSTPRVLVWVSKSAIKQPFFFVSTRLSWSTQSEYFFPTSEIRFLWLQETNWISYLYLFLLLLYYLLNYLINLLLITNLVNYLLNINYLLN